MFKLAFLALSGRPTPIGATSASRRSAGGWDHADNQVYFSRSRDGGLTWTDLGQNLQRSPTGTIEDMSSIVFDPNVAGTIYAIQNERLYRTTDAGESWQQQPDLVTTTGQYFGIALPPGRPG